MLTQSEVCQQPDRQACLTDTAVTAESMLAHGLQHRWKYQSPAKKRLHDQIIKMLYFGVQHKLRLNSICDRGIGFKRTLTVGHLTPGLPGDKWQGLAFCEQLCLQQTP